MGWPYAMDNLGCHKPIIRYAQQDPWPWLLLGVTIGNHSVRTGTHARGIPNVPGRELSLVERVIVPVLQRPSPAVPRAR